MEIVLSEQSVTHASSKDAYYVLLTPTNSLLISKTSVCYAIIILYVLQYTSGSSKSYDVNGTVINEPRHEKTCLREIPSRSDSNWPAQLQKLAWGLKFWLQKLETLHNLGSEQQRRWSDCADAYDIIHVFSWPGSLMFVYNGIDFLHAKINPHMSMDILLTSRSQSLTPRWREKGTKIYACKISTHMHERYADQLSLYQARCTQC